MSMTPELLRFLREQFPSGSRIKLKEMGGGAPCQMPPGSKGTLHGIDEDGAFGVKWDNGPFTTVNIGSDRFSVEPPEPHTMKLYMPFTAELYEQDDWGDMEEPFTPSCLHNIDEAQEILKANQIPLPNHPAALELIMGHRDQHYGNPFEGRRFSTICSD